MQIITADILQYLPPKSFKFDALCCTTNTMVKKDGTLVMGAGIARIFADEWDWLPKEWGQVINQRDDSRKEDIIITPLSMSMYLVAFPTKRHWKEDSQLDLIEASLKSLVLAANFMNWRHVLLPRPGCLNGGLSWEKQVQPLCTKYLDDRFTVISKED